MSGYKNKLKGVQIREFNFLDLDLQNSAINASSLAQENLVRFKIDKVITDEELAHESKLVKTAGFKVQDDVRQHRGLKEYEEKVHQQSVKDEIDAQLAMIKDQAYQEGFNKGKEIGAQNMEQELRNYINERKNELDEFMQMILADRNLWLEEHKNDVIRMVNDLVKWVLQREFDGEYVSRLFTVMLNEFDKCHSMTIKLDAKSYVEKNKIITILQKEEFKIQHFKVEQDDKLKFPSLVIESDGLMIDGNIESKWKILDNIFLEWKSAHEKSAS